MLKQYLTYDSTQSSRRYTLILSVVATLLVHGTFIQNNVDAFQLPLSTFQLRGELLVGLNEKNHNQNGIRKKDYQHIILTSSSRLYALSEESNHLEMPFEQEGAGTGGSPQSITPTRIIKHKNRKKKKMRAKKRGGGKNTAGMKSGPLTKEELATHVSSQYVAGPGGLFKQRDQKNVT